MSNEFTITNNTDFAQAILRKETMLAHAEAAVCQALVTNPLYGVVGASSNLYITVSGTSISSTAKGFDGSSTSNSAVASQRYTLAWSDYHTKSTVDKASNAASPVDMQAAALAGFALSAGDWYNAKILSTLGAQGTSFYANGTASSDVGASHTLSQSLVGKAYAQLKRNKARPVRIAGQNLFLACITPEQERALKAEANGIIDDEVDVRLDPSLLASIHGHVGAGFFWVTTADSNLVLSGVGAAGVDVHRAIFTGADSLGEITSPIAPAKFGDDYALRPDMAMILRVIELPTDGARLVEVNFMAQMGWQVLNDTAIVIAETGAGS